MRLDLLFRKPNCLGDSGVIKRDNLFINDVSSILDSTDISENWVMEILYGGPFFGDRYVKALIEKLSYWPTQRGSTSLK